MTTFDNGTKQRGKKSMSMNSKSPFLVAALVCAVYFAAARPGQASAVLQYDSANYNYALGTWTDTASGNNATQTGTARPTLVPGATPNGQAALNFNPAASQWLNLTTSLSSPAFEGTPTFSIMVVAKPNYNNNSSRGQFIVGGNDSISYAVEGYSAVNAQHLEGFQVGPPGGTTSSMGLGWNVFAVTYDGATADFYKNGAQVYSVATVGTFSSPLTMISTPSYTATPFDGQMAALQVYNTALSSGQIATFSTALATEYIDIIPEPSTVLLFGMGGLLMWIRRRRS